ncbi:MAG TPA: hypothetical protein VFC18_16315 [Burkholderiales bacterium]|nr:hypothetical protein [Burkholderiales bacterium]
MITLGGRSFAGPFLTPLWQAPRAAGVYAVLVPGWRLLTFRALHFGAAGDFAYAGLLKGHARYAEWLRIAGTDWNLYVGTHEMSFSTEPQRQAAVRELERGYRPEFHAPAPQEAPSLKTMLLAQAMRQNRQE